MEDLQYPTGRFRRPPELTDEERAAAIAGIAGTPAALRAAVSGLTDAQLDTPYRPAGWTVRQVTHHVADSHLNAYVRFKLALTEEVPTIKPYQEALWAQLPDSWLPVEVSLRLLASLHERWDALLRSVTPTQWSREFVHPETGRQRLDQLLALYAWHGPHHVAQVTGLRKRMGW